MCVWECVRVSVIVCMNVCICMSVNVCVWMCDYVCECICVWLCVWVYMCVMIVYVYKGMWMCVRMCVWVCMRVCEYVCVTRVHWWPQVSSIIAFLLDLDAVFLTDPGPACLSWLARSSRDLPVSALSPYSCPNASVTGLQGCTKLTYTAGTTLTESLSPGFFLNGYFLDFC